MPTELRRLLFTRDELAEALADYARATGRAWPAGKIRSVRPDAPFDGSLVLRLRDGAAGGSHRTVKLEPEWVAAALIRFCAERGVVLPRRAQKSLELVGDAVSLNIVMQARTLLKIVGEPKS